MASADVVDLEAPVTVVSADEHVGPSLTEEMRPTWWARRRAQKSS